MHFPRLWSILLTNKALHTKEEHGIFLNNNIKSGLSLFSGSKATNKRYFNIFSLMRLFSSQLYSHETDLIPYLLRRFPQFSM